MGHPPPPFPVFINYCYTNNLCVVSNSAPPIKKSLLHLCQPCMYLDIFCLSSFTFIDREHENISAPFILKVTLWGVSVEMISGLKLKTMKTS